MPEHTINALNELIQRIGIDWQKAIAYSEAGETLDCTFDIEPHDFVSFAEQDLEDDDNRALVNALSNAKRAIDSQIDKMLLCFGVPIDKLGISRKIELLQQIDVVAPKIIRKVRDARNYLEHEYKLPIREQVEDAVDIASLFVTASSETLSFFPTLVVLTNFNPRTDFIRRFQNGLWSFFVIEGTVHNSWFAHF